MTLDGNSIVNRAFYGIRQLTASDGTPTNAVYGFLAILQKLIDEESPDALCVTFDLPAPTFRHERYSGYKAKRTGMPDELAVQMPILKDILDAMKIPRYELAGWEADDLLGLLAKKCEAEGWECVIVTGDKDSLQLVTKLTRVKHIKTKAGQTETKEYTTDAFVEEYGFAPMMLIDLKALMGDASDSIPGVAGIGEKTALELVRDFGGIAEIYGALGKLNIKDAVRKKLEDGRESAEMSFDLARIRTDAPLAFDLKDSLRRDIDNDKLFEIFKRLGFTRLTEKFGLKPPTGVAAAMENPEVINVTSSSDCASLILKAREAQCIALRLDTDYFDFAAAAFPGEGKSYLIRKGATDGFENALEELLSGDVEKAGHDVKDIMRACRARGIETDGWVFDTALGAYLASPTDSNYAITRISERYCGYNPGVANEENGQLTMLGDSGKTVAYEAYAIMLLLEALGGKLREGELEKLYFDVELPLCSVLAEMERIGFLVDKDALVLYGKTLSGGITETEKQIYELAGETFNINSPKQLGAVLFDKLMLPAPKKTKTGYSTNIEVLDSLTGKHPIVDLIKDYRELAKLKSTYADGLLKVVGDDGRIHTRFMMTVTATGRLSSAEPNLQNIPVRKQIGGELRKMFVSGDGNVLVDADYSQIELRILAHIAGDTVMRSAFERGEDIHTVTASQVFGVPTEEVTSVQRSRAKAVNFGIVYGISSFSLAQDIGVMPKEAKSYIDSYLDKYAGVRKYMSDIVESAKKLGYVSTLFGRRRYLPELRSANFNTRSFGERVALNMPIQGTAADIMKIAMISAANRLKSEGLSGRLILQVHDELIAECPEHEADAVGRILREEMENAAQLSVPLVAETRAGKSWYEAK
ncbi:MAG: DNA polymerase I [Oscillospiraceae bacterium]|jgi:DNA polymerase-1|nr:DNA polymerase I [Oscillospiraceae bacterium]